MGPLNTWSRAPKTKRAGCQGFGGNIFVAHGGKIFCHFTHQLVSCSFLFRAMENPPTSAALAELDSDPDSPHLDQFPPGQQRSSLGLYHSLHNHLRHPDDRRTTWKEGEACRSRSCSWLFTGARQRLAVDVFPRSGGFRGVADFVHGKMDGNACVK